MKQNTTAILSGALITLGLTLSGNGLRAQAPEAGPLTVTVSLAGSSTVSLGEPILLKYTVKNSGDLPASVFTADKKHNLLITAHFTDVAGKPLALSVNPIPPHYRTHEMRGWDGLSVKANTSASWETVANAAVVFPRPGNYVLRVHIENPYVTGDIDQGAHYVLGGDSVFPLKVVAANPAYLKSTAERLRQTILQTTDVNVKAMLVKALFSMPESVAAASWQSLVEEPKLDGYFLEQIGTALARLHTIKAVDILAEMVWEPAQSGHTLDGARSLEHLYEIYDTGDPTLRKHIEDLHKQHGVEVSRYRME